ncbi:MAG: DEAD/DEAH box helicase [Candidatus Omnitrophota bacterium]
MPDIYLSPHRRLYVEGDGLDPALAAAFARGSGHGMLFLDAASGGFSEEPSFAFWKDFTRLYLSLFTALPDIDSRNLDKEPVRINIPAEDLSRMILTVPPMKGVEYVDEDCLRGLWRDIEEALAGEIRESGHNAAAYFAARHSHWSFLGRVCFHLAENKKPGTQPFAFLATYAHAVAQNGRAQHILLGKALEEYGGAGDRNLLLRLLAPIYKAAEKSAWLKAVVDSGDIYRPLAWTPQETYRFLKDIPVFAAAGIFVKVPDWWKPKQSRRPQVAVRIGERDPGVMGLDALLDFNVSVMLGAQALDEKEVQDLLSQREQFVLFKGQWVEIDKDKLGEVLARWKSVTRSAHAGAVTFAEGMRWLAGVGVAGDGISEKDARAYTRVVSGQWLTRSLDMLRSPGEDVRVTAALTARLKTTLRPYQRHGVAWLNTVNRMRLGAILADDMGLGKTIQVLALLLLKQDEINKKPSLLIVPASLMGNWQAEIRRFAPSLTCWTAHISGDGLGVCPGEVDLVITTYGSVGRLAWLAGRTWGLVVADEAQAIKNPAAKQTRAVKALKSFHRLVLTGTPVENHLSDLWSLFDFVAPGLLGSIREFDAFIRRSPGSGDSPYAALRTLVRPYILRRLKTDKSVIADLPDKTEAKAYCMLSREQVALYQKSVESLANEIGAVKGIRRRGVILAYLMRFKQICNHPSHFIKDGLFSPGDSGKFLRLKEICEVIAEKQEKVLVFSQFREMTAPLAGFLQTIFGKAGLILDGGTPIRQRAAMVAAFQEDDGPPFFVLSLKTGGMGLNLTAASHVIHFDRWWNPAVENQATDRAYRIGQKRNVLVHKFICRGTLEEKIDMMIESKQALSRDILEGADTAILTEMANDELIKVVSLDIKSAGSAA